jgi:hypothetical protein
VESIYLYRAFLIHSRGKAALKCNQREIMIVNDLWKTVDKAVVVTLPKIVA